LSGELAKKYSISTGRSPMRSPKPWAFSSENRKQVTHFEVVCSGYGHFGSAPTGSSINSMTGIGSFAFSLFGTEPSPTVSIRADEWGSRVAAAAHRPLIDFANHATLLFLPQGRLQSRMLSALPRRMAASSAA
jgi:hypothetical protein